MSKLPVMLMSLALAGVPTLVMPADAPQPSEKHETAKEEVHEWTAEMKQKARAIREEMRQKLKEAEQEMKTKSAAIRKEAKDKLAALKREANEHRAPATTGQQEPPK